MPKGDSFIEYPEFEAGYETLKKTTQGFHFFNPDQIRVAVLEHPIVFIVLRTILGFSPPEWAHVACGYTGIKITQTQARDLDSGFRCAKQEPYKCTQAVTNRLDALIKTACYMLEKGAPEEIPGIIHRLDKADTKYGLIGVQNLSKMGVPYAMLLYERYLGRPFATHRDSVSDIVGSVLETAVEKVLAEANISHRKTKRIEKIPGFDQAPDFILPSEYNPLAVIDAGIVIEAKITEDDGTARDKVTRLQHLASISEKYKHEGKKGFAVIACIEGRGFGQRREDMKKLLRATKGMVFTPKSLVHLPSAIEKLFGL